MEKVPKRIQPIKCTMISPYFPDKCGIALYTSKLLDKLKEHTPLVVIANKTREKIEFQERQPRVLRCWKRNNPLYFVHIWKAALSVNADIIHIQHEFLAYGVRKYAVLFPLLLFLIRLLGKPVVVTMHSVVPRRELKGSFFGVHGVGGRFASLKGVLVLLVVKLIGYLSNMIIVHNDYMKRVLVEDYGLKRTDISVVPHGTDNSQGKAESKEAKRCLGLTEKRIILFFGFIIPGKGIEFLLDSFSEVERKIPEAMLIIAGGYHPRLYRENPSYVGSVEAKIKHMKLSGKVVFRNEFIPDEELGVLISAADIVVLPYSDGSVAGASGALSTCALFAKPVVATEIPRFLGDIKHEVNGLLVKPGDSKELTEALLRLMDDDILAKKLGGNLFSAAQKKTWDDVAQHTLNIYREILESTSA